jgi:hypothetical protein
MASRLQDVIQRGLAGARPLATAVAPGTLYYSTDTTITERSDGTTWQTFTDSGGLVGSSTVLKLAAPFVVEAEETVYEPQLPLPSVSPLTLAQKSQILRFILFNNGSAITTGTKGYLSFPVAGTIVRSRLIADQVGSIVVDIWKDTFAAYPPTVADTITSAAKPTLTAADHSEDTTLTGWNKVVNAGDTFGYHVDSVATVTYVAVELTIVIAQ